MTSILSITTLSLPMHYHRSNMTQHTFFVELQKLLFRLPKPETQVLYSENCLYADHVYNSINLNYCFDTSASSDSTYLFDCHLVAQSADCDYTVESESCYECVDVYKCFNCFYIEKADNVRDAMYGYDLSNCHDVFGCVNLTNKSYCIFNRQLTKETYLEEIKKYRNFPPEKVFSILEELKNKYPLTQSAAERNINSPYGNYVYDCKNCYMCFDTGRSENCSYLFDSGDCKNSLDMTYSYKGCDNSYQIVDSTKIYNSVFIVNSESCQDSAYLFNCKGVKNSLGCVGLQYKEYCILNRQFSKEEYNRIVPEIKKILSQTDTNWGNLTI
jgi:hypothetical protein